MKAVLLDTSILIHDPESVCSYGDTKVLIPIFVIMELDLLKDAPKKEKGHISHLARKASSLILSKMESKDENLEVVSLGDEISLKDLDQASQIRYIDLLILQTAMEQNEKYSDFTLVSKDVNLRIICESVGLKSEDYSADRRDTHNVGIVEVIPDDQLEKQIAEAYWQGAIRYEDHMCYVGELYENKYIKFISHGTGKTHLFIYKDGSLSNVDKKLRVEKAKPRNIEQTACLDLLLDSEIQLVAILGKAGTGKTFLALAAALEQQTNYSKIVLSKPVVDVGNGIGFLPGSLSEKLEPWMQSFFDNLDQISPYWDVRQSEDSRGELLDKCNIEIQPIHSIRGRSLKNAFMIIDEAQNLTKHEIKSVITRAAEGTKVVLLGDPYQIDHPYLDSKSNGLIHVIERMKNQPIFGCMELHRSERSTLSDITADLL
jgi:PhoH-like ATPase